MAPKTLTVRLPESLFQKIQARKSTSLNKFLVQAAEEKLERERQDEIAKSFESLVEDFDQEEFDYWQRAQQEAMDKIDG